MLERAIINPFTAPACKNFQAERCTDAPADSIFSHPINNQLSIACILMKILSTAGKKIEKKWLKDLTSCTFIGRFHVASWQISG